MVDTPSPFQNIDFSNDPDADEPALVMERSQVTIDCSMQYTLKLDKLTNIYSAYELNYHDKMVKVGGGTCAAVDAPHAHSCAAVASSGSDQRNQERGI